MSPTEVQVLMVGLTTLDIAQVVRALPRSNEKVVATSMSTTYGGPAANAAGVARGLGVQARLLTGLGTSRIAGFTQGLLDDDGISVCDATPSDASAVAVSTVLIEDGTGDRAVVSTNATGRATTHELPERVLAGVDAVLVDGHSMGLCIAAARAARALGIPVVMDGGSWKDGTEELLGLVDVPVFSDDFRAPNEEDPVDYALGLGATWAAQTGGERPSVVASREHRWTVAPEPVQVVDTLGAGDVLHGALTVGVAILGASPEDADDVMRFATGVATLSCQAPGARGWMGRPDLHARAATLLATLEARQNPARSQPEE